MYALTHALLTHASNIVCVQIINNAFSSALKVVTSASYTSGTKKPKQQQQQQQRRQR